MSEKVAGDSQVTFPDTVLSPPILYNRWQKKDSSVPPGLLGGRDE
jgi:hypothetical protein